MLRRVLSNPRVFAFYGNCCFDENPPWRKQNDAIKWRAVLEDFLTPRTHHSAYTSLCDFYQKFSGLLLPCHFNTHISAVASPILYCWYPGNVIHSVLPDAQDRLPYLCNPCNPCHCATVHSVITTPHVPSVWSCGSATRFFRCKVPMPELPRTSFPIGIPHYGDFHDANSQLNLFNIPQSRHPSSDDSDPGSPSRSHGGARTAHPELDPALYNTGALGHSQPFRNVTSSDDGPYIPTHTANQLSINSAIRSTTSPFVDRRRTISPDSPDLGHPVCHVLLIFHGLFLTVLQRSPTESERSDRSVSLSVHSDRSVSSGAQSDYGIALSGHGGQSHRNNEPTYSNIDFTPPARQYPYHSYQDASQGSTGSPHYYRMGDYQGVIAPDFEVDDSLRYASDVVSSPQAGSSTASTPASGHSHLPQPAFHTTPSTSDAEKYLRHQLGLPRDKPVDLWALRDPPDRKKPVPPYPNLIKLAIFGSPNKKLTLQEIYKALIDRFDWFKDNENELAWKVCSSRTNTCSHSLIFHIKNSIRHNLSLNQVFVNTPRPITEPGKGSYWRLDLSKGEGYKRPRIRKSRAQQREINERKAAGEAAESSSEEPTSPQTPSSAEPSSSAAGVDESVIDPQLRTPGHIVGERRTRPRRPNANTPYPLRTTPSPVPAMPIPRPREESLESSRSEPSSGLHMVSENIRLDPMNIQQEQVSFAPPFEPSSMMQLPTKQPSYGQPSFGGPSPVQPPFGPSSFGPSSYGSASYGNQPSFGHSSIPSTSAGNPLQSRPAASTSSLAFMAGIPHASFVPPGSTPPPPRERVGIEYITDGALPKARRVPSSRTTNATPLPYLSPELGHPGNQHSPFAPNDDRQGHGHS